jgi:hypothetical protein
MDRAEEYRRHGDEVDEISALMRDPELKLQFREIAEQWRALARQVERWRLGRHPRGA